jgi:hypothetical protein
MIDSTSKYDAILICNTDDLVNESYGDPRAYTDPNAGYGRDAGKGTYFWYDDPRLYAQNAFGRMMLSDLNGWRQGYSAKVSDFGKWVVVEVTYHHHVTGRSASKTFLVVFDGGPKGTDKAGGMVLSTANKWRTISGYGQAVNYIKSASTALESGAQQKI